MSKVRDFNLLKVADVSSSSTNTNSVSVVVNADSSGNSQNNEAVNFHQQERQSFPAMQGPSTLTSTCQNQPIFNQSVQTVAYPSVSTVPTPREQELTFQLENINLELQFYKLLSQTLSNMLASDNAKLIINLIDQTGKIIIEAQTLIELIAIKTNTDKNLVNIQFVDEEPTCFNKVSPIKRISNIKIDNENFNLKYNREYNILQDDYKISLDKVIIPEIILDKGILYGKA